MYWTSFWTDSYRYVSSNHGVSHNPVFIEQPLLVACEEFERIYAVGVISDGAYIINQAYSIEEVTAWFRGCVMTDRGFVEESRADHKHRYYSINKYLKLPNVLTIENKNIKKADGSQCSRCKEFVLWAAPNQLDGTFRCRACKLNPYR